MGLKSTSGNLPTEIVTVDLATGNEISTRRINYARGHERDWLIKHLFHCHYNGKGVAFNPIRERNLVYDALGINPHNT